MRRFASLSRADPTRMDWCAPKKRAFKPSLFLRMYTPITTWQTKPLRPSLFAPAANTWSWRATFPDRVLNLHPALLPSFKGAHAIQDAFEAGVKVTGVTVHFANAEYDKGPIVAQRAVEVAENDTLETLEEKIHAVEHELYPHVLQLIAENRVTVDADRKVRIS